MALACQTPRSPAALVEPASLTSGVETNYWNQHPTTHYLEDKVLTQA